MDPNLPVEMQQETDRSFLKRLLPSMLTKFVLLQPISALNTAAAECLQRFELHLLCVVPRFCIFTTNRLRRKDLSLAVMQQEHFPSSHPQQAEVCNEKNSRRLEAV
jgi:hypothetical protein